MSYTETHFGKLRKVELNSSIEEWCKEKCNENGIIELSSYYDNWEEEFSESFEGNFFIVDDEVWEIFDHIKESEGDDINIILPNEDGTLTFVQQFYNGGTCLSEMIEEGLKRLKLCKK